ncbi:hypothetical protein K1719_037203 [Acacia pycnantha]|nr:hypothetical protein K1719_037203 [Acacia pycnantha]
MNAGDRPLHAFGVSIITMADIAYVKALEFDGLLVSGSGALLALSDLLVELLGLYIDSFESKEEIRFNSTSKSSSLLKLQSRGSTVQDKNPRYIEGSIAEAFLVEETTKFGSYYYPPEVISRWRGVPRNDDGGVPSGQISIFNYPGRVVGKHCSSTLEGIDKKVAEWYILNNCEEADPYLK